MASLATGVNVCHSPRHFESLEGEIPAASPISPVLGSYRASMDRPDGKLSIAHRTHTAAT
jgi:hypothetical protein